MTVGKRIGLILGGTILLVMLLFAGLVWLGRILPPAGSPVQTSQRVPEQTLPPGELLVPVPGVRRSAIADSWGDPRENGLRQHHGTDIPAAQGTPVLAAGAGTIEKLRESRDGGTVIYQRSADGGWIYYYAHLAGYAPGLHEGQQVTAGEAIAFVGDTGDAGAGNFHLHFGLTRMRAGERWWQGQDVNPYPILAGRASVR